MSCHFSGIINTVKEVRKTDFTEICGICYLYFSATAINIHNTFFSTLLP